MDEQIEISNLFEQITKRELIMIATKMARQLIALDKLIFIKDPDGSYTDIAETEHWESIFQ